VRDGELVAAALAKAEQEAERTRLGIEQRLASISAEIARAEQALDRYYEAFEQGKLSAERCDKRLSRLQARLEDLRAQEAELAPPSPREPGHAPTPADLTAVADQLKHVLAEGEPQNAKALLRLTIQELRVDGRAQIHPTYKVVTPAVCATSEKSGASRTRTGDLPGAIQNPRVLARSVLSPDSTVLQGSWRPPYSTGSPLPPITVHGRVAYGLQVLLPRRATNHETADEMAIHRHPVGAV
jgi:exonuclease VII small subunit